MRTPEGLKVQADIKRDTRLYSAPMNPPGTGTAFTTGTDLYCHKARSGRLFYYGFSWSLWQGDSDHYKLLEEDGAKEFVLRKATIARFVAGVNEDACKELWGEDFFDEDA